MTSESKRTLVKSAPELWELADDLARMEAWMGGLVGEPGTVPVQVTERQHEQLLVFAAGEDPETTIAIELSESGFGTAVRITAPASSVRRLAVRSADRAPGRCAAGMIRP